VGPRFRDGMTTLFASQSIEKFLTSQRLRMTTRRLDLVRPARPDPDAIVAPMLENVLRSDDLRVVPGLRRILDGDRSPALCDVLDG